LEGYLAFGMVPGARSIFKKIEKLPPAHVLVVEASALDRAPQRYWQLRIEPDFRPSAEEWQEAIRAKLRETIKLHLIADVPVGAFQSGGVDSSVVVASTAGATECQGGAVRRRRRRGLWRLRALRPRFEGGGGAPLAAGLVPPGNAGPAGPRLAQGGLAAAAVAGEDAVDEPGARRRLRLRQ